MSGRLDLGPLISGALAGLRKRRVVGDEPPDLVTRAVLFGGPVLGAALMVVFQVELSEAGTFAEGGGVLVGALLAGFAMVAMWRDRLLDRDRSVDRPRLRALDEAAAHTLLSVLAAMAVTATLSTVANIDMSMADPSGARTWAVVALGAVGIAAFIYIAISLVIVVNLLWDAYRVNPSSRRSTTN